MIQEGAKLATNCSDILEELNISSIDAPAQAGAEHRVEHQTELALAAAGCDTDSEEMALLQHIGADPVHIDEVGRRSGLPITAVNGMLTLLELKGEIRQVGCMHYVKSAVVGAAHGR
jgi:DNA processing protein